MIIRQQRTHTNKDYIADAGWGWNEKKKKRELNDPDARFLLVRDAKTKELIAFTHFRFLVEYHCKALYCYELHVSDRYGRRGIGKRLMTLLEIMARKFDMDWVMLTVLLNNTTASAFYRKLGYSIDESTPQMNVEEEENHPYEVLSKKVGAGR